MFSFRKFLRALPASLGIEWFRAQGIVVADVGEQLHARAPWRVLDEALENASADARDRVLAALQEADELANEAGIRALREAAPPGLAATEALAKLDGAAARALWMHWQRPAVFARAREIAFFDGLVFGRSAQRARVPSGLALQLDADRLQALTDAVRQFYRAREGAGEHVHVEVARRYGEGATQLTMYVAGLSDVRLEFEAGELASRCRRPAMELAVVYREREGVVETAVRGGRHYHDHLRGAFIQHLLLHSKPVGVWPADRFHLERLRHGVPPTPSAARLGIERVCLKQITLRACDGSAGLITWSAGDTRHGVTADALAQKWFGKGNPLLGDFVVVQTTIDIHRVAPARPVALAFRRDGTVKWNGLSDEERTLIEQVLVDWKLEAPLQAGA